MRAPVRLRALVGQRRETVVGVANEPAVKRPSVDAVAGGGVLDGGAVEDLPHGVGPLLKHRKIHQWRGVLLGSVEHE
jgi:hypothetical protein